MILNNATVIRFAVLGFCWNLTACMTHTQPSAVIAGISPKPAPVFNFQVVSTGSDGASAVYRSGQPTEDDWGYLEQLGIKTVIKLNQFSGKVSSEDEVKAARAHHIAIIPVYMPPEDLPHNLDLSAHPDKKVLEQALSALANSNRPVLVHCSHGKDRTGLVIAAYRIRYNNWCKKDAIKEMEYYGTNPLLTGLKPMLDDIGESPSCK